MGSTVFDEFCTALNKTPGRIHAGLADLPFNHAKRMVTVSPGFPVDFAVINYAKWIKEVSVSPYSTTVHLHWQWQNVVSRCSSELTIEEVSARLS